MPVPLALSSRFKKNAQNLCRSISGTSESSLPKLRENCASTTLHTFCTKNGAHEQFLHNFSKSLWLRLAQVLHDCLGQAWFPSSPRLSRTEISQVKIQETCTKLVKKPFRHLGVLSPQNRAETVGPRIKRGTNPRGQTPICDFFRNSAGSWGFLQRSAVFCHQNMRSQMLRFLGKGA